MRIRIEVDGAVHEAQLRTADIQLIGRLLMSEPLRDAAERLFGFNEPSKRVQLAPAMFKADLRTLSGDLVANQTLWAASYRVGRSSDNVKDYGTGIGGLIINGQTYAILAGLGFCELKQVVIDEPGTGHFVNSRDVRSLQFIDTDNLGKIRIMRKPRQCSTVKLVEEMGHLANAEITNVIRTFSR